MVEPEPEDAAADSGLVTPVLVPQRELPATAAAAAASAAMGPDVETSGDDDADEDESDDRIVTC